MRLYYFLIFLVFSIIPNLNYGQASTASPYSAIGFGQVDWNGSGRSQLLAGTGIGLKSDGYLNNLNPASYSSLDSSSFIFEIGLQSSVTNYKSYNLEQRYSTTSFNYLAMGFLISKWWRNSIGIKPFSHVGYNITVEDYIEGTTGTYFTYFKGEGDISQIYWGNSFSPIKNLSFGFNASYLFGPIEQKESIEIPFADEEQIITRKKHLSGFYFDYGLQYTLPTEKWDYTIGMVYGPEKGLNSTYTLTMSSTNDTTTSETIEDGMAYKIPQKIGVGFSMINKEKTLSFSADYRFEEWSKIDLKQVSVELKNSHRCSFGIDYHPAKNVRDSYIKRVHYIFGGYYASSNLEYKGVQLDEKGLTLGLVLPIKKDKSNINMGFEVGERGSLASGLIKENYYKLNLSFTLQDNWFQKKKYR